MVNAESECQWMRSARSVIGHKFKKVIGHKLDSWREQDFLGGNMTCHRRYGPQFDSTASTLFFYVLVYDTDLSIVPHPHKIILIPISFRRDNHRCHPEKSITANSSLPMQQSNDGDVRGGTA